MALRSIERIAADRAYSGRRVKLCEGAPWLVWPPTATYSVLVAGSSAIPLEEWFSSDRGRPRTRSSFVHDEPLRVSRERIPELVSRLVSVPAPPPPIRGSEEPT